MPAVSLLFTPIRYAIDAYCWLMPPPTLISPFSICHYFHSHTPHYAIAITDTTFLRRH